MTLAAGTRFGPYEVSGPIGAGGMGEVYRARDTKLNREVALKVLPELFARDPERLARFEREAQLLASLNHPNIAHIHGVEETAGTNAIVLELVEGPTLADRIARGAVPLGEALAIARQIADALEAAHENNVIHRDLKPANIKVREDGTVKVLDFGLAKALSPDAASGTAGAMNSPTMSARATEMGLILGTAAYMSPEQAKGKTADRRADVWAFGVVLFEMLTGRQAFTGETPSEVMASVMKEEPNWAVTPATLPAPIRRLLRRCLEKDPKKRLSSMSDVRLELTETDADAPPSSSLSVPASVRRSMLPVAAATITGIALTAAAFLFVVPALRPVPAREAARVSIIGPEGVTLYFEGSDSTISPDGRHVVFTIVDANGSFKLWLRSLASLQATPIAGTDTGHLPFWSPDSQQIAFFTTDKLKKVPVAGGTIQTLCDARDGRGGTWGSQNTIVFAPSSSGGLESVSANGGDPKPATSLDAKLGQTGHRFPWFLPDGKHFLFASLPAKGLKYDIFVGSIDDASAQPLMESESAPVYADPGYLLFARKDVLVAQPFDSGTRQLSGEPLAIGDAPSSTGGQYSSGRAVSVSNTGTIAYLGDTLPNTKFVWFDRAGKQAGTVAAPEGRYQEFALSPDGQRAAIVQFETQNRSNIWIVDLIRGGATRFTTSTSLNIDVQWSPDGNRILFSSDRQGPRDLYLKPANGATQEQLFYGSKVLFKDSRFWVQDNSAVLLEELSPDTNRDLWILPMAGTPTPKPYLQTQFNETNGVVSPDGKWMAYISDETGRGEVYVDSFPTPRNKYRVSDQGALFTWWRKDGKELAVLSANSRELFLSDVQTDREFKTAPLRPWMSLPRDVPFVQPAADFQRVLVSVPVRENATSTLTLIFDWVGALGKK
jgi:eukaryotic-like serine/threonine-protein kinase